MSSTNDWGEDDAWDSGSDSESKAAAAKKSASKSPTHSIISKGSPSSRTPTARSISTASHAQAQHQAARPDPIPISPRKNSIGGTPRYRQSPGSTSTGTGGADRSSSSVNNLSFSYTHVQHPSPSSYTPASMLASHVEDVDWQEQERDERERAGWTIVAEGPDGPVADEDDPDAELEESSVSIGAIREPAVFEADESEDEAPKEGKDAIKPDVEEIVKGVLAQCLNLSALSVSSYPYPPDPLFSVRRDLAQSSPAASGSRSNSPALPSTSRVKSKSTGSSLARGRSLRSNRKYSKVVDCLNKPDVKLSAPCVSCTPIQCVLTSSLCRRPSLVGVGWTPFRAQANSLAVITRLPAPEPGFPSHYSRAKTG